MLGSRFMKVFFLLVALVCGGVACCQAATVLRTLTYHQITGPADLLGSSPISPVLSANGNRAAFSLYPSGTEDPAQPNRIFVMNPDGTGFQQVDSYTSFCFCGSSIDISANGAKVVSTDNVQVRIANGDGSGAIPLIALDSNEINGLAISADGTKVFFRIYRSTSIRNTNPSVPIENGIYVINANGSGLRQIVGPSQLAAVTGLPATAFGFFGNIGPALRSSQDGGRLVFACQDSSGQRFYGVNLDGSGLHDYFGLLQYVYGGTISSDGAKVGFLIKPLNNAPDEIGIINFDGSGRLKLVDSTQNLPGTNGAFYLSHLQLTPDGEKLFVSDAEVLLNTDGSGAVSLGLRFLNDDSYMVSDGFSQATMNSSATKILYAFTPIGLGRQVFARLDVNPASLGSAPSLTQPLANPTFVVLNGGSTSTLSVRATNPVTQVGSRFIRANGLPNNDVTSGALRDDGAAGDVTAADGVFTTNTVYANSVAAVGPHTVRLKGEIADAGGKLHATAIEFEPFSVVATPPPLPSVSVSNVTVAEGNSGTVNAVFTVSLSSAAQQSASVNFTTAGNTAATPDDYTAKSGTLTFSPGDISKTVSVVVKGDTVVEPNETFFLNLSSPVNLTLADVQGIGTITNDDVPLAISVNNPRSLPEGNIGSPGSVTFDITLNAVSAQTVTVNFQTANGTNNPAIAGTDYVAKNGKLTFAPGETLKRVTIFFIGDSAVELNETFFFDLKTPTNAIIADGRGVGQINNDDGPGISIASAVTVDEGNSGTKPQTFVVTLSVASPNTVTVDWTTANNTATTSDYVAASGTLTFLPGAALSQNIIVQVKGDTTVEPNETYKVNLSKPIYAFNADSQAIGIIRNDDAAAAFFEGDEPSD